MSTTSSTPAELWEQVRHHVATIRSETARVIVVAGRSGGGKC